MSKAETTNIGKDDAALVFHENGSLTIVLPESMTDKSDAPAPKHVLLAVAISSLLMRYDPRFAELLRAEARNIAEMSE